MYNNDKDCCGNCVYMRDLKHNFEKGTGYVDSHCCVMWEYDSESNENGYNEGWIQEVDPNSICENFHKGDNSFNVDNGKKALSKLLNKLKEEYSYCECVEFIPFPSITPELMQGYTIKCDMYDFNLSSKEDCANCQLNKRKNN